MFNLKILIYQHNISIYQYIPGLPLVKKINQLEPSIMLNIRYIKSIYRDIFVLIAFPVFLFQFLFCYILERKDKKWFKRDIIVLISFLILFVSISFLVNNGKEMSLPGFRTFLRVFLPIQDVVTEWKLTKIDNVHLDVAGDVFDGVFLCCPFYHWMSEMKSGT